MIRSGFFNSVNQDRKYNASDFAEYFASFISSGVFPNPSTNLQVMANDDMTVTVKPGKAWINGYVLINDDDYILNIDVADGVLNRIDRIVARYDVVNREITLEVKKGTFASSPTAPILQRDADAFELGLADVYIGKGVVSINQSNITDLRQSSEYCGIVHGVVNQVDVTTLYNQYTQGFKLKQDEFEQEFMTWFQTLQDVLDENTASNLLNMINATNSNLGDLSDDLVAHKAEMTQLIKVKSNIIILATGWVDDTATSGFWIYDVEDEDITASTVVDVNIHLTDLEKAESIKSANLSSAGKVTLYAEDKPTDNIVADLKLIRQVV